MNYAQGSRILYFNTGAGNNLLLESANYSINSYKGIEPKDATHINIYFDSAKGCNAVDTVELEIVSGQHTAVITEITKLIFSAAQDSANIQEYVTTIFDGDTGIKYQNDIIGCTIIQGTPCAGGGGGTTYQGGDGIEIDTSTSPDTIKTDLKANGGLVIESTELAVDLGASSITGTLAVADGGTGNTTMPNKSVIISQDSGTDKMSGVQMTGSGQLLIGGTSGPAVKTLTAGTGVSITNGDGSITIARSSAVEFASFTVSGGDNGKSTPNGAYLIPNRDGKAFYEVTSVTGISFADVTTQGINFNIAHRDLQLESFVGAVVTSSTPTEECDTHMKFVLLTDTLATGETAFNFTVTVLATFAITSKNVLQTFDAAGLSVNIPLRTAYAFAFVPDCDRIETWSDIKGWANISCVG